jgi:hypothetical protein
MIATRLEAGDDVQFTWGKRTIKGTIIKTSEETARSLVLWEDGTQSWHDISLHLEVGQQQWTCTRK